MSFSFRPVDNPFGGNPQRSTATPNATSGGLFGISMDPNVVKSQELNAELSDELIRTVSGLLATGSYSDLTIKCGKDVYSVHRAVICPRSDFFAKACDGDFKEAKTGHIDLPEDDPSAVKMMIKYFYDLDYDASDSKDSLAAVPDGSTPAACGSNPSHFSLHTKVYALAEKFGIERLKKLAALKFEEQAKTHWNSDDFSQAIREVYTSTVDHDRALRDIVVETCGNHPCVLDKTQVQDVVKGLPDFMFDLLMHHRNREKAQDF